MPGRAEAKLALLWKAHTRCPLLGNQERAGGLAMGGFPCCRWRRCWAWQRDRAQAAKLPEPLRPCSTRWIHGEFLAGAWLQSSHIKRTAWHRSGSVLHLGATGGVGNARMASEQPRGSKAVTRLFSEFSSARWVCNMKAKIPSS